jgi:hypothetical protein
MGIRRSGKRLPLERCAKPGHLHDYKIERPKGFSAIIARQDTEIIVDARQEIQNGVYRLAAQIRMQIAQMQNFKAVEGSWNAARDNVVLFDADLAGIAPPLQ